MSQFYSLLKAFPMSSEFSVFHLFIACFIWDVAGNFASCAPGIWLLGRFRYRRFSSATITFAICGYKKKPAGQYQFSNNSHHVLFLIQELQKPNKNAGGCYSQPITERSVGDFTRNSLLLCLHLWVQAWGLCLRMNPVKKSDDVQWL